MLLMFEAGARAPHRFLLPAQVGVQLRPRAEAVARPLKLQVDNDDARLGVSRTHRHDLGAAAAARMLSTRDTVTGKHSGTALAVRGGADSGNGAGSVRTGTPAAR